MRGFTKTLAVAASLAVLASQALAEPIADMVAPCWLPAKNSTATVKVRVLMTPDAMPETVTLISSDGASRAATEEAFKAARRAVLRCAGNGYALDRASYDRWREIEMTFDPRQMGR